MFPFDSRSFSAHEHQDNPRPLRIGHAPTNRAAKGSDVIIPILRQLAELEMLDRGSGLATPAAIQRRVNALIEDVSGLVDAITALAGGRTLDSAMLKQTFAGLLDEARGLAPRYRQQIEQKAATIDTRSLASLIKQV